ncbi:hypothetical protein IE077_002421 [Cardiosporidium cionae]|uniref:Pentatricopeptide repeat-containing protein n=1 Tax=Cardiosporidium cionae TaxID=476202 RepID=A0ABQ7JAW5_9APIC|nr:hypothetical protein IE077_002421 [Cardiosporidium cionae]|eukprot:KAF8821141.1 hypothetical protein IE077_002421 [Cardiosporidium cionae]
MALRFKRSFSGLVKLQPALFHCHFGSFSKRFESKVSKQKLVPSDLRVRVPSQHTKLILETAKSKRIGYRRPLAKNLLQLQQNFFPSSSIVFKQSTSDKALRQPSQVETFPFHAIGNSVNFALEAAHSTRGLSEIGETAPDLALLSSADIELTRRKNRLHRDLWRCLKVRKWKQWEQTFDLFKAVHLPQDEVSYTLLLHGLIISKDHDSERARNVLEEMKQANVHPALVRLNEVCSMLILLPVLLNFYFNMEASDVRLTDKTWRSVLRAVWLIAALVKGRRERFIARLHNSMQSQNKSTAELPQIHDLSIDWYSNTLTSGELQ